MSPRYEVRIRLQGELGPASRAVLGDLDVAPGADRTSLISGELPDQAALHGLLAAVRDLGLQVISAETFAHSSCIAGDGSLLQGTPTPNHSRSRGES